MISGFFYIDSHHIHTNKQIHITQQWLEKHLYRLRGKYINNFICRINDQPLFSLSLWISENDEVSDNSHVHKYEFIFSSINNREWYVIKIGGNNVFHGILQNNFI
jgi:hypothetical protein